MTESATLNTQHKKEYPMTTPRFRHDRWYSRMPDEVADNHATDLAERVEDAISDHPVWQSGQLVKHIRADDLPSWPKDPGPFSVTSNENCLREGRRAAERLAPRKGQIVALEIEQRVRGHFKMWQPPEGRSRLAWQEESSRMLLHTMLGIRQHCDAAGALAADYGGAIYEIQDKWYGGRADGADYRSTRSRNLHRYAHLRASSALFVPMYRSVSDLYRTSNNRFGSEDAAASVASDFATSMKYETGTRPPLIGLASPILLGKEGHLTFLDPGSILDVLNFAQGLNMTHLVWWTRSSPHKETPWFADALHDHFTNVLTPAIERWEDDNA